MDPTITYDLHSHLLERKVNGKDYWKQADSLGIDVMAITEHAHFAAQRAFETVARTKPPEKILVPGIELNTNIGHVLCYAANKQLYREKKLFENGLDIEEAAVIAMEKGFVLSVAHPWGFQHDSAAFLIGPKKLLKIVKRNGIGIEAYNGMVGHLSDIVLESGWVKRPVNFLDFLQKNRVARKIGLSYVGRTLQRKVENSMWNSLLRIQAGVELGEKAGFITAGSDAHIAERIGEGMLKFESKRPSTTQEAFDLITKREKLVWCGTGVEEESPGVYRKIPRQKIKYWEAWDGIKYATKRTLSEKVWKKIKRKKKEKQNSTER
jgi:hypothetical protein